VVEGRSEYLSLTAGRQRPVPGNCFVNRLEVVGQAGALCREGSVVLEVLQARIPLVEEGRLEIEGHLDSRVALQHQHVPQICPVPCPVILEIVPCMNLNPRLLELSLQVEVDGLVHMEDHGKVKRRSSRRVEHDKRDAGFPNDAVIRHDITHNLIVLVREREGRRFVELLARQGPYASVDYWREGQDSLIVGIVCRAVDRQAVEGHVLQVGDLDRCDHAIVERIDIPVRGH